MKYELVLILVVSKSSSEALSAYDGTKQQVRRLFAIPHL
jgi:hypothetical protein